MNRTHSLILFTCFLGVLAGVGCTMDRADEPESQFEVVRQSADVPTGSVKAVGRRLANEAEVQAFVTKARGGIAPKELATGQLDSILQRIATTQDVQAKRALTDQFRSGLHAMTSADERKAAIRRYVEATGERK